MLERLRMQEVEQIVLSVPEGAIINGTSYTTGEPVMVINNPGMSNLEFKTSQQSNDDGRGFISASGLTNNLDFVINEGSVLYSVWSYLYGTIEQKKKIDLKGTEWLYANEKKITLSTTTAPSNLILYEKIEGKLYKRFPVRDYQVSVEDNKYIIILSQDSVNEFFVAYDYDIEGNVTTVKQIRNNIFCAVDIYIDALDMDTDEHHKVCIKVNKAQIFMDMVINANDSRTASFTPIRIKSIPEQNAKGQLNKDVATIVVI